MNKDAFDDGTKLKLDIFGECFEEWLPVFGNDLYTKEIYVFDFFAGSGSDKNGINGSPLILLSNTKSYCQKLKKPVKFIFNEIEDDKVQLLKDNIDKVTHKCISENDCRECVLQRSVVQYEFNELFNQKQVQNILEDNKIGKFILLDQYGFKHVNDNIFRQLINYPKTDFIFFISSSNIRRFKKHNSVKKYIETDKVNFNETEPKECHRAIAGYFKTLVDKEYYIHHFTIKKGYIFSVPRPTLKSYFYELMRFLKKVSENKKIRIFSTLNHIH